MMKTVQTSWRVAGVNSVVHDRVYTHAHTSRLDRLLILHLTFCYGKSLVIIIIESMMIRLAVMESCD